MSCLVWAHQKARYTMAVDYDNLGKRISSMRNKKKLSQEELGEKLNVTREYISMIETNRRVSPL